MTATNPWGEPPIAPELTACKPVYAALGRALHTCSLDEELLSLAAVVAVMDLAGDLIVNAGLLWKTPDLVAALRSLVRRPRAAPE